MRFLHQVVDLDFDEAVEVIFDAPEANVILVNADGFLRYQSGEPFLYFGGNYKTAGYPILLKPDGPGRWHLVVDRRGRNDQVNATYRVVHAPEYSTSELRRTR